MPKEPKDKKRPTDVIGNAVHVMRIATGDVELERQEADLEGRLTAIHRRYQALAASEEAATKARGGAPVVSPHSKEKAHLIARSEEIIAQLEALFAK